MILGDSQQHCCRSRLPAATTSSRQVDPPSGMLRLRGADDPVGRRPTRQASPRVASMCHAHAGGDRRCGAGRADARPPAAPPGHRVGRHRDQEPRLRRTSGARRCARAADGRPAARDRPRWAACHRRPGARGHRAALPRALASHRLRRPDWFSHHGLWATGGREGPHRGPARRRAAAALRGRRRAGRRPRQRPAARAVHRTTARRRPSRPTSWPAATGSTVSAGPPSSRR